MLIWASSILVPKHPLSGSDTETYSNLHVVLPGYQPKEDGNYR